MGRGITDVFFSYMSSYIFLIGGKQINSMKFVSATEDSHAVGPIHFGRDKVLLCENDWTILPEIFVYFFNISDPNSNPYSKTNLKP